MKCKSLHDSPIDDAPERSFPTRLIPSSQPPPSNPGSHYSKDPLALHSQTLERLSFIRVALAARQLRVTFCILALHYDHPFLLQLPEIQSQIWGLFQAMCLRNYICTLNKICKLVLIASTYLYFAFVLISSLIFPLFPGLNDIKKNE